MGKATGCAAATPLAAVSKQAVDADAAAAAVAAVQAALQAVSAAAAAKGVAGVRFPVAAESATTFGFAESPTQPPPSPHRHRLSSQFQLFGWKT